MDLNPILSRGAKKCQQAFLVLLLAMDSNPILGRGAKKCQQQKVGLTCIVAKLSFLDYI
jgi:hypothetical protein